MNLEIIEKMFSRLQLRYLPKGKLADEVMKDLNSSIARSRLEDGSVLIEGTTWLGFQRDSGELFVQPIDLCGLRVFQLV